MQAPDEIREGKDPTPWDGDDARRAAQHRDVSEDGERALRPAAQALIDEGRAWLEAKYSGYWGYPAAERRVLAVAWLCDVKRAREKSGRNDGELVEALQASGGGKKGDPWCAFAQGFCAMVSKSWRPRSGVGAVYYWRTYGEKEKRTVKVSKAKRGDLLIRDKGDGKRHIACALKVVGPMVYSIEGNTSPGDEGSQRDGQGMYRRTRLKSFWTHALAGGEAVEPVTQEFLEDVCQKMRAVLQSHGVLGDPQADEKERGAALQAMLKSYKSLSERV